MSISISELLGKKHPIGAAERTFVLVKAAVEEGNLRLAVSRGITVVIMATAAAMRAPAVIVRRAEELIQATRDIVHGAVIKRVALNGLMGARRPQPVDKVEALRRKLLQMERKEEEEKKTEEEIEKKSKKIKPEDLPFVTQEFPAGRGKLSVALAHGRASAGTYIPTPGDPWGQNLLHLISSIVVDPRHVAAIIPDKGGLNVYGERASQSVLEAMDFLYKVMPWKVGTFIPTPGDPGGEELMSHLRSMSVVNPELLNPAVMDEIESHSDGLKVYGPDASKAVSEAVTRIKKNIPWTRFTVLGSYPMLMGA